MLAIQYDSLSKILEALGEKALAREALANKARQLGDRQNPPNFTPFRRDRRP
jgi:hypothetical protein